MPKRFGYRPDTRQETRLATAGVTQVSAAPQADT
jgi:hypothetical protein